MIHARKIGLIKGGKEHNNFGNIGKKNILSNPVVQYGLDGTFIKKWDCINDVERTLSILAYQIGRCCNLQLQTAGGFLWKHYEGKKDILGVAPYSGDRYKPINQYDLNGEFIKKWSGTTIAAQVIGVNRRSIQHCLKNTRQCARGYFWQFASFGNDLIVNPKMQKIIDKYKTTKFGV